MYSDNNITGKSKKLVNWVTVWGFIFACIAFNLYVDNRQHRIQYEAASQRADSLYIEKIRLEQRLQQIETTTVPKMPMSQSARPSQQVPASEL